MWTGSAVAAADVVIHGADTHLLYFGLEQPAASEAFSTSVDMVETNFVLPSGLAATREQIMQVLEQLQGLYIRATYSEQGVTTRPTDNIITSFIRVNVYILDFSQHI